MAEFVTPRAAINPALKTVVPDTVRFAKTLGHEILDAVPKINPALKTLFSDIGSFFKASGSSISEKYKSPTGYFPILALVVLIVIALGAFIWYTRRTRFYETGSNIGRITKEATQAQAHYDEAQSKRVGLRAYMHKLKGEGIPDTHLSFTNFYVSTVNAAGLFFPAEDGVISPMAARAAVVAGARAFVFDIWPDLTPGAQYGPILQAVESGSMWRRISMNSLPFVSVLKTVVQEAFEMDHSPGYEDPLILYLRFRGKPRSSTYTATAAALRSVLEQYRLDASFNNCKNDIYSLPITNLFRKVILVSNVRAEGNALDDYINIGPKNGIKMEWQPNDVRALTLDAKPTEIKHIQQNLTWVAPLSEDPAAESNTWNFALSQAIGIQFCAMNFWKDTDMLKAYMAPTMFGTQSFCIKPVELRHVIDVLPAAKYPENPRWGSGTTAGTPVVPPAIRLP